jgi:hypothetical protein
MCTRIEALMADAWRLFGRIRLGRCAVVPKYGDLR